MFCLISCISCLVFSELIQRRTFDHLGLKPLQRTEITTQHHTVQLNCPEDYSVLTIDGATYGSDDQASCNADVGDIVVKLCNSTNDTITCILPELNEHFEGNPCFNEPIEINITYTCTQPSK